MKQETLHVSGQRVAAALTTLSRLALRTSALRLRPQGSAEQWAAVLLRQLLALCVAHQGAVFVTKEQSPNDQWLTVLGQPVWSMLTCCHWHEQEADAALQSFALASDSLQWSEDTPVTICWKRSLSPLLAAPNDLDNAHTQITQPLSVIFLLRWSATETELRKQEAALQQVTQLLPRLADLVDTILLHILTVHTEEEPLAEVLPSDLLATVGHELRGPLTTIQGYAETLLRHEQHLALSERQEFLQAISQASTHVGILVDRFLELAQFETQTHTFLPVLVNMHALAQESIAAMQAHRSQRLLLLPTRLPEAQIVAESSFDENHWPELTVSGDRRLLRSMLDILLENALVYSTPESLVEVSLSAKTFSTAGGLSPFTASAQPLALILPANFQDQEPLLEICVQDHGRGIAPEELSTIFRRFYRGDTRLTREVNGLGLGLTLCKAIVAQHRGMLWVESVQGKGSTFHILLPCKSVV